MGFIDDLGSAASSLVLGKRRRQNSECDSDGNQSFDTDSSILEEVLERKLTVEEKKRLREARRSVPRYLFRACSSNSYGNAKTSTQTAVIPAAYLLPSWKPHRTLEDFAMPELTRMSNDHVTGKISQETEFSSWSAQILMVLGYAEHLASRYAGARFCIMDTMKLRPAQGVYHVPLLLEALGLPRSYEREHLVHGIVEGDTCVSIVSYEQMKAAGLLEYLPELAGCTSLVGGERARSILFRATAKPSAERNVQASEIDACARVGQLFGSNFRIPLTCALIAARNRGWVDREAITAEQVDLIRRMLEDRFQQLVRLDYAMNPEIIVDYRLVYPPEKREWFLGSLARYREMHQFNILLKALHEISWGKCNDRREKTRLDPQHWPQHTGRRN